MASLPKCLCSPMWKSVYGKLGKHDMSSSGGVPLPIFPWEFISKGSFLCTTFSSKSILSTTCGSGTMLRSLNTSCHLTLSSLQGSRDSSSIPSVQVGNLRQRKQASLPRSHRAQLSQDTKTCLSNFTASVMHTWNNILFYHQTIHLFNSSIQPNSLNTYCNLVAKCNN